MPERIHLSLACGTYDINQGLITGAVVPQGIELSVVTASSPQRHWRMARNGEFDVCEFSLASYLLLHDRGDMPLLAIPAFPHRRFRHEYIYVNSAAGIREPKQLEGRRIGIRTWQTTAGLWARGILQDEYGVDLSSIQWFAQDVEDIPLANPDKSRITIVPKGKAVTQMLEEGDLDGLIYPEMPQAIVRGDPRVSKLFPDSKAADIAYFRKTGFFPLMHTVIVRQEILDRHPWVARELLTAFRASKDLAFQSMRDPRRVSLAWFAEAMAEQERVLGKDPWCYEFEPNRKALETMIRWATEQGLISKQFPAEDLYAASTLVELPHYV